MEDTIVLECQKAISNLEAMGCYARFGFGETSVGYYCDDTSLAEWLCHFFAGYFVPSTTFPAHAYVYCANNPTLWNVLQNLSSRYRPLKQGEYREITHTPQSILIHKLSKLAPIQEDIYYYLLKPERKLLIISSCNPQLRRIQGADIIRALMRMLLIERGWLPFHAACCTKDGQGICITGDKFAGKTSTLINLLATNGFHLVATDKLLLYDGGTHLLACGLPLIAGIRPGTLLCHPPLLHWLKNTAEPFFPHLSLDDIYRGTVIARPNNFATGKGKIRLLPAELASLFGVSIDVMTSIKLFLAPMFNTSLQVSSLVPSGEGRHYTAFLMSNYPSLAQKGEGYFRHFFDTNDEVLKERLSSLLTRFLPDIPLYELHQSSTTNHSSAMLIADLVSQLKRSKQNSRVG